MQLPVEQYYELDPAMIRPLGGKRFALQVPRVNVSPPICMHAMLLRQPGVCWLSINQSKIFSLCLQLFNVWVEPLVEVVVHLSDQKDAVILEVSMIPVQ